MRLASTVFKVISAIGWVALLVLSIASLVIFVAFEQTDLTTVITMIHVWLGFSPFILFAAARAYGNHIAWMNDYRSRTGRNAWYWNYLWDRDDRRK